MLNTTRDAVKALLRADTSITAREQKWIYAILQSGSMGIADHNDRIVRRVEAAAILGRSTRAVDRLAATGVIRRIRFLDIAEQRASRCRSYSPLSSRMELEAEGDNWISPPHVCEIGR